MNRLERSARRPLARAVAHPQPGLPTWLAAPLIGVVAILLAGLLAGLLLASPARGQDSPADGEADDSQWLEGIGENELVLVHGLGANASIWDAMVPYLKNNFQLHVYELHGHGATPPLASPSISAEVAALGEWIEAKGLIYPTVVGHGLGGMIAMQYAFENPADVKRLVIIDATPRQLATQEQKDEIAHALLRDYDRFVASRFVHISADTAIGDRAVDMALRTDSTTFASLLLDSFDWDLSEQLPRQSVPMLVIGSQAFLPEPGNERAWLREYGFDTARTLHFKLIEGSGHYLMLEQPTYLGSVITVWVREGD